MSPLRPLAGVALAPAALVAAPAVAGAATTTTSGSTRLTLDGPAATALQRQGVKVSVLGPAKKRSGAFVLPVKGGKVNAKGSVATVQHGGRLRLRHGKRSITLGRMAMKIGKTSKVSGRLGSTTRTLFTVRVPKGAATMNGTTKTVSVQNVDLRLTAGTARALNRSLGLKLRAGRIANLLTEAIVSAPPATPAPTPAPTTPAPPTSTAVPVVAASVVWRQRTSWMQYVESGRTAENPDGGTTTLEGAVAGPVESLPDRSGNPIAIPYTHSYPFASGWYDPATGTGSIAFSGGIRHRFPSHGIDLSVRNPTIELNGASSKLVATLSGQTGSTLAPTTTEYVALDASASPRTQEGNVVTITGIPGTVPAASSGVFAGFYAAGEPYGSIDQLQLTLGG
ncbi:HtaA domain-containing protein [Patulibacter sp. S7RM1-6]